MFIYKKQSGLTLIEVLLSLLASLLIISFLLEYYLANQRNIELQNTIFKLQYAATLTKDILHDDISQAGYIGCAKLSRNLPAHVFDEKFNIKNKLISKKEKITVKHAEISNEKLLKQLKTRLYVTVNKRFSPGDILLISDCKQLEVFQVKNVSVQQDHQIIEFKKPLHFQFSPQAEISQLVMNTYFIKNDALVVENINHQQTEIMDHVKNMKFHYAIIKNQQLIELPAEQIQDWGRVVGIAVDFMLEVNAIKKNMHFYIALNGSDV